MYRVGQKVSYCTFFIYLPKILTNLHNFLPVDFVRNLLLSGIHTTLIFLDYLVKYKYPNTYTIYRW